MNLKIKSFLVLSLLVLLIVKSVIGEYYSDESSKGEGPPRRSVITIIHETQQVPENLPQGGGYPRSGAPESGPKYTKEPNERNDFRESSRDEYWRQREQPRYDAPVAQAQAPAHNHNSDRNRDTARDDYWGQKNNNGQGERGTERLEMTMSRGQEISRDEFWGQGSKEPDTVNYSSDRVRNENQGNGNGGYGDHRAMTMAMNNREEQKVLSDNKKTEYWREWGQGQNQERKPERPDNQSNPPSNGVRYENRENEGYSTLPTTNNNQNEQKVINDKKNEFWREWGQEPKPEKPKNQGKLPKDSYYPVRTDENEVEEAEAVDSDEFEDEESEEEESDDEGWKTNPVYYERSPPKKNTWTRPRPLPLIAKVMNLPKLITRGKNKPKPKSREKPQLPSNSYQPRPVENIFRVDGMLPPLTPLLYTTLPIQYDPLGNYQTLPTYDDPMNNYASKNKYGDGRPLGEPLGPEQVKQSEVSHTIFYDQR